MRRESAKSSKSNLFHFKESWELKISKCHLLAGKNSICANSTRLWCLVGAQIEFPIISCGKRLLMNLKSHHRARVQALLWEIITTSACINMRRNTTLAGHPRVMNLQWARWWVVQVMRWEEKEWWSRWVNISQYTQYITIPMQPYSMVYPQLTKASCLKLITNTVCKEGIQLLSQHLLSPDKIRMISLQIYLTHSVLPCILVNLLEVIIQNRQLSLYLKFPLSFLQQPASILLHIRILTST